MGVFCSAFRGAKDYDKYQTEIIYIRVYKTTKKKNKGVGREALV